MIQLFPLACRSEIFFLFFGVHDVDQLGSLIHWSLQFGLTWRLLHWQADTKSNENADQSSMLAISDSLIFIP